MLVSEIGQMAEAFVKSFVSHGGYVHPKVDLFHPLDNGDRGVLALDDIKEGEQLVMLPNTAVIKGCSTGVTAGSNTEEISWAELLGEGASVSPFIGMVLYVLAEMAKGSTSEFWPYFEQLPATYGCVMNWSHEEKAWLKGTAIEVKDEETETIFQREVLPRMLKFPKRWPPPYNTFDQFCRVASLVQSRAFHMVEENWVTGSIREGTELYLLPAIDMLNHASDPARRNTSLFQLNQEVAVEVDGRQVSLNGYFSMKADRDIASGEEVLHTYGDLSDGQLLLTYGFVDIAAASSSSLSPGLSANPDEQAVMERACSSNMTASSGPLGEGFLNPFNFCLVPWSTVVSCCQSSPITGAECKGPLGERKRQLLQLGQVLQAGEAADKTEYVVTHKTPLSEELLTAVQVMVMMEEEFSQLEEDFLEGTGEGEPREPLRLGTELVMADREFAELVTHTLLQVIEGCLSRYPTSMVEDEALLKSTHTSPRRRLATLVAYGEKQLLMELKQSALKLMVQAEQAASSEDQDDDDDEEEEEEEEEEDNLERVLRRVNGRGGPEAYVEDQDLPYHEREFLDSDDSEAMVGYGDDVADEDIVPKALKGKGTRPGARVSESDGSSRQTKRPKP